MALTKVINYFADLNQSGSTNALKGCAGTTAERPVSAISIEYLIVGGGGTASGEGSGGGGAGGLLTGSTSVHHGTPTVITVGEGAVGSTPLTSQQVNGNDSGFNGIRAVGGGSGQRQAIGSDGGTGGGGGAALSGGSGTAGQGLGGGAGDGSIIYVTGGGGGAGTTVDNADGTGATGSSGQSGNGGSGRDMQSFISNTNAATAVVGEIIGPGVWFAGGGGGGGVGSSWSPTALGGTGGSGGAGDGSGTSGAVGGDGISNTGGGGGGGVTATLDTVGGNGGSGVVILKYDNTVVTNYTVSGISVANTFVDGTDTTLVFKIGTGTISFQGSSIGMLRYNSTLGQMEHFNSGGWKYLTNTPLPPITANLYTYVSMVDTTSNANFVTGTSSLPTTWVDISGNSRDWTVNTLGASFTANPPLFYFELARGTTTGALTAGDELTLETWVNISGTSSQGGLVGGNFNTDFINAAQTAANFTTYASPVAYASSNDFLYNIPTGVWLQVVFTVSKASTEKKLFVNGVQQGATQTGVSYWDSKSNAYQLGVLTAWVGIIRIYSDVLTDAEVLQNYNYNKADYGLP